MRVEPHVKERVSRLIAELQTVHPEFELIGYFRNQLPAAPLVPVFQLNPERTRPPEAGAAAA